MRFVSAAFVASIAGCAFSHPGSPHADAQGRYTLEAEGIKAQFIPYGATLTNLWVKGKQHLYHQVYAVADLFQTKMACSAILSWATTTPRTTVSIQPQR
jgi:hypothetical protein